MEDEWENFPDLQLSLVSLLAGGDPLRELTGDLPTGSHQSQSQKFEIISIQGMELALR